ncbi:CFEM domain-containing protein [Botrytis cinerea]
MQFTIVSVLALASLALAQDSGIPSCAQPCIDDAAKSETTCGATDKACQCLPDNVSKIQTAATTCVIKECGITVALTVPDAAAKECASLPASSAAPASTSSASAAPSSSAVESSSSAAALSSSAAESSPVVSSTAASTLVSSTAASTPVSSTATPTPVSSVAATTITSGVAAPTGSNATATGPSPTSSTAPFTGAGAQVKASFAGALVLGVVAALAF